MAPSHYHLIERFPLSRNGKLIAPCYRQAPNGARPAMLFCRVRGTSLLRELLADTLGLCPDKIDPCASFFSNGSRFPALCFGATSSAPMGINPWRKSLATHSSINLPSVCAITRPCRYRCCPAQPIVPLCPPLHLVHGAGGQVHQYAKGIKQLTPAPISSPSPARGCRARRRRHTHPAAIGRSHLAAILRAKRDTAVIAGWSLGGQLAVHMAAQATEQGAPFAHAVLVDSGLPAQHPQ